MGVISVVLCLSQNVWSSEVFFGGGALMTASILINAESERNLSIGEPDGWGSPSSED